VAGGLARMVTTLPAASVADHTAAQAYLSRLAKLGGYFDGLRAHLAAKETASPRPR
jgi:hypothetical protein